MRYVCLSSLAALLLAACSSDGGGGGGGGGGAGRLLPLEVGNSWTYKVTDTVNGTSGNKTNTVEAYEDVGGSKAGTMAFRITTAKASGKETVSWQEDTASRSSTCSAT
jgi:hypothetical protein